MGGAPPQLPEHGKQWFATAEARTGAGAAAEEVKGAAVVGGEEPNSMAASATAEPRPLRRLLRRGPKLPEPETSRSSTRPAPSPTSTEAMA